ncbi:MAG: efflux RND transporter periplasmic adaptor subunit [Magnetococcus sp. DMHC-1]|nr:efflux RND transporter periplasmic adaptor subunit [Magnetococcales bacterium]
MSWKKFIVWLLLSILLGTAGYAGWQYRFDVPGYSIVQEWFVPPLETRYKTLPISRGHLARTVTANGTLNPVVLVNVGTQVSGTVQKLHVDYNSRVEKDQILVELDPALSKAQVRQSEANMASARASLDLAKANAARMRTLFQKEFVSRQEWDQATQAVKSAQAQLALAQAQNDKDRTNLAYTIIRSPVSGVVVDRQVDVGQTVAANFQTPTLFRIAQNLSKMQIDANFAEADIGQIRVDQEARFTVDAFPNRSFQGTVQRIRLTPLIQQNVVTYDVVIAVENPELILMPGMTAYVRIVVAQRDNVLLIPNSALRFRPATKNTGKPDGSAPRKQGTPGEPGAGTRIDGSAHTKSGPQGESGSGTVHQLLNNALEPVRIGIGITDNRQTEMTSGKLQEGDLVVVEEARSGQDEKKSMPPHGGMRMRMF